MKIVSNYIYGTESINTGTITVQCGIQ